ncbi:MAG: hypothetical protein KGI05_00340 [Thaumarchaeota archaeon]|nr:hypothetical protein [Nitrososphaerota archaeon]
MKTLHLSIIFVSLLSITIINTNLPAAQGISGPAYFMKSNSTAKIYANFAISVLNNQSWDIKPEILTSLDDFSTKPPGLTIDAQPSSFIKNMHHVHVTYTITAKGNTKGVYPLFLFSCGTSPLVVGLDESEVSPAIYNKFFTAAYACPAVSTGTPDMNIIGYSGIISKILTIDSNNTITVTSVSKLGEPPQSPLKQFKSGIQAKNVTCTQGLELIFKFEDSSPACVRQQTAQTLVEHGWGMWVPAVTEQDIPNVPSSIKVANTNFTINYNIVGNGKILDARMDAQSKSLILSLETTSNGTLTVSIPRALLDIKKNDRGSGEFYVLADGQETIFKEIHTTPTYRIFSIPFQNGTKNVEIIATELI